MQIRETATIEDLYRVPENGKAELVNGELVLMSSTGWKSGRASGRIYISLDQFERKTKSGYAIPDNAGFIVSLPNRQSFSPDAAFYVGDEVSQGFLEGAPAFAVEVRSEGDYGKAAETVLAAKRYDYFAAGTKVVWDVDLLGNDVIKAYRASDPENPVTYRRGDIAEAEPAVPGWTFPVDELFA